MKHLCRCPYGFIIKRQMAENTGTVVCMMYVCFGGCCVFTRKTAERAGQPR